MAKNLMELINKEDIAKVISYSQDIPNPKIDKLLSTWAFQKQALAYDFLDNNVIVTSENKVTFEMSDEDKNNIYQEFLMYLDNLHLVDTSLIRFAETIGFKDFYANRLSTNYDITLKDNKRIPKGSKVVKAFKYFIDDEQLLTDVQNHASEIIQANKVEGYLHLSIHPLDFLSSSETTYNWRSCHSLDGEYRAGNLSYMDDASTIIAYLSSDKKEKLPRFPEDVPWNSKKWRMLLHFNTDLDVCFAGRQYPFFSRTALDLVKELFDQTRRQQTFFNVWSRESLVWDGWYNTYLEEVTRENGDSVLIEPERYCIINGGVYDRYKIVKDAENSQHFNDVRRSSFYTKPYYMYERHHSPNHKIKFLIGSPVECLWCGDNIINGQDSMMCTDCECVHGNSNSDQYITCDCCGSRVYIDEASFMSNRDEWVCPNCAMNETFLCEECGGRFYNSEKHWKEGVGYVCDECFSHREKIAIGQDPLVNIKEIIVDDLYTTTTTGPLIDITSAPEVTRPREGGEIWLEETSQRPASPQE